MFYLSAGDAAQQLGVHPRVVSNAFYEGHLDTDRCPLASGRRLIPADYLPQIEAVLRKRGKLPRNPQGNVQMSTKTTEPTLQAKSDLFVAGVEVEMSRNGGDRQRAVRVIARRKPQLHEAFLAHTNPDFGKLRVGK